MSLTYYWLTVQEVIVIHDDLVREFGGSTGVLDEGALEFALYRPQQLACYEPKSKIRDLAAAYGYGLVNNHCFVDENKRTALNVMAVFLLRNWYELVAPEVEVVDVMVSLAKGEFSQAELAAWLTSNIEAISE